MPRGIVLGIFLVLIGYLAVNVAFISLLGHDGLAASKSPAADATEKALGPIAGKALDVTIILSAAGILNTVCLGFPFVIYAMARRGVNPEINAISAMIVVVFGVLIIISEKVRAA